jgi:hypothetical protein
MGDVLTRTYRHGALTSEGFPLADVPAQLAAPDTILWIDPVDPRRSSSVSSPQNSGCTSLPWQMHSPGRPDGAFMALPLAALITAVVKNGGKRYEVVYQSTHGDAAPPVGEASHA